MHLGGDEARFCAPKAGRDPLAGCARGQAVLACAAARTCRRCPLVRAIGNEFLFERAAPCGSWWRQNRRRAWRRRRDGGGSTRKGALAFVPRARGIIFFYFFVTFLCYCFIFLFLFILFLIFFFFFFYFYFYVFPFYVILIFIFNFFISEIIIPGPVDRLGRARGAGARRSRRRERAVMTNARRAHRRGPGGAASQISTTARPRTGFGRHAPGHPSHAFRRSAGGSGRGGRHRPRPNFAQWPGAAPRRPAPRARAGDAGRVPRALGNRGRGRRALDISRFRRPAGPKEIGAALQRLVRRAWTEGHGVLSKALARNPSRGSRREPGAFPPTEA